jgi:hypothetical protein
MIVVRLAPVKRFRKFGDKSSPGKTSGTDRVQMVPQANALTTTSITRAPGVAWLSLPRGEALDVIT